jgi:gamma-glutamylcyclotransferase (GGCT)/AIG2-like uncharacterized protein YtfP
MPNTYQLEKRTTEEILLFVYGTLMSGMSNNDLLADSKFIAEVTVESVRLMDLGYFPGMIEARGELPCERVYGELWEVSKETLDQIDVLEGHPDLFVRSKVPVRYKTPSGSWWASRKVQASSVEKKSELVYAYFYNGISEIHSGDWRQFVEKREGGQG